MFNKETFEESFPNLEEGCLAEAGTRFFLSLYFLARGSDFLLRKKTYKLKLGIMAGVK